MDVERNGPYAVDDLRQAGERAQFARRSADQQVAGADAGGRRGPPGPDGFHEQPAAGRESHGGPAPQPDVSRGDNQAEALVRAVVDARLVLDEQGLKKRGQGGLLLGVQRGDEARLACEVLGGEGVEGASALVRERDDHSAVVRGGVAPDQSALGQPVDAHAHRAAGEPQGVHQLPLGELVRPP